MFNKEKKAKTMNVIGAKARRISMMGDSFSSGMNRMKDSVHIHSVTGSAAMGRNLESFGDSVKGFFKR